MGAQIFERATAMISRHGVVHAFPQSLDAIDPGVVGGLEEQLELGVFVERSVDGPALVDPVVVENEHDARRLEVHSFEGGKVVDERHRVLSQSAHPHHHLAGARAQGPGDVGLSVLARRGSVS